MSKIETMSYAFVVSDKKLKGSGLSRGDIVMVTGTKMVPASRHDPYLMREIVVAIYVEPNGNHHVPGESNEYKAYLIDPRSLAQVDESLDALMKEALNRQYGNTQ